MSWRKVIATGVVALLMACGSKQALNSYDKGDYAQAFSQALDAYKPSLKNEKRDALLRVIEASFARIQPNELAAIRQLESVNAPRYYQAIFEGYQKLEQRQSQLSRRLPLNYSNGQMANFSLESYTARIEQSRNKLTDYLVQQADQLLNTNSKTNFREAYNDLLYVRSIDAYKPGLDALIQEALNRGTTYVYVSLHNSTPYVIPRNLEDALLDFNTMQLNSQWTQFSTANRNSDYRIEFHFTQIAFSPDQVHTREFERTKEIKTGSRQKEIRGVKVFDDNGRPVMEDVYKTVHAKVFETTQNKNVAIQGVAMLFAPGQNSPISKQPIQTEFVFTNCFARYQGDIDAVESEYIPFFRNKALPFPSNEQMLYDSGEHLKTQFKSWVKDIKFP